MTSQIGEPESMERQRVTLISIWWHCFKNVTLVIVYIYIEAQLPLTFTNRGWPLNRIPVLRISIIVGEADHLIAGLK